MSKAQPLGSQHAETDNGTVSSIVFEVSLDTSVYVPALYAAFANAAIPDCELCEEGVRREEGSGIRKAFTRRRQMLTSVLHIGGRVTNGRMT